jgi:hypothetical protein
VPSTKNNPHTFFFIKRFCREAFVGQNSEVASKNASSGNFIVRPSPHSALTVFDASHGQPNWAQTGFTSREMHTNFAGVMELLCRFGFTCAPTGLEPLPKLLARARLLVIPPPAGRYNSLKRCWMPASEALFNAESIREILQFVQDGGRLLAFAYRFGDSFMASNMRELVAPLGCLLNDDAVVDLQLLRETFPLKAFFDTPKSLLPLSWASEEVNTVRWRTMASFSILPGANVQPLALSAGGCCISFNRTLRRISFSSLPIAVAGTQGRGRFVLCGGPHVFETGAYGLLASHDNARFLQNIVRWLLEDGDPCLNLDSSPHHSLGTFFFNNRLEIEHAVEAQKDQQTIAYVENVMRKTGILKALNRPKWVP